MNTNSSALIVPAPQTAAAGTNDIRGLKGPVEVPADLAAWMWLAGFLVAALAAFFWRRRLWQLARRMFGQEIKPPPPIPPHVRARHRLTAALAYISDPKLFCSEVSDTLRVYLEERFRFHAPERTTEEFLIELQASRLLNSEQKQSLAEFLQGCDLVKFARFEPTETALRELHDSALRLVDETQFDAIARREEAMAQSA